MSDNLLDSALPDDLKGVIGYETKTTGTPEGETKMPEITLEQVKAVAAETAASLLKQKDAEQAVAAKIESLTTDATNIKAELTKANASVTDLTGKLAESTKTIDGLKTELVTASSKVADLEKSKVELTKANATLTATITKGETDKAIASRTEKLKAANLLTDARASKYNAVDEASGKLVISDAQFDADVAELTAAFEAGKASAKPASAPAAAPAASAAPAAAPDLSSADAYTQATAALLAQPVQPTANGVSKYASAFGELGE